MIPLPSCELRWFVTKTRKQFWRNYVLILVSYCCDIADDLKISGTKHRVVVERPFVRRTITEEDNWNGVTACGKS